MTCVWVACESDEMEAMMAAAAVAAELAGVEEGGDGKVRLWLAEGEDAGELCRRLEPWRPVVERVEDRNWNEPWQSEWKPVEIGQRFFLVPPDDPAPTPATGFGWPCTRARPSATAIIRRRIFV